MKTYAEFTVRLPLDENSPEEIAKAKEFVSERLKGTAKRHPLYQAAQAAKVLRPYRARGTRA